jgi:hypothetical protein
MRKLHKFLWLSNSDRQLLLNTFILLGLVRLGLWLLPFQRLRQLLTKLGRSPLQYQQGQQIQLSKIVWAVNLSSRYLPGKVKCLARALTTQVIMTRHGFSPQLRIGVAKGETGKLEAHAWIESQGKIVIGYLKDLSRFTPLPSLEGERL